MWILYQLAMGAALLAVAPFSLARRGAHYLPTLRQRLGAYGRVAAPADGALWIHAVSVGEVAVAEALARALPADLPMVITTVTPTGQARARAAFADRGASVAYLPFDLGFAVGRFFRRFRPSALILIEGDYWPLVLATCQRRQVAVAVVNGRVGATSFGRWRGLRRLGFSGLWARIHQAIGHFGVQTDDDRERLVALGADAERITVTGNLKFESPEPPITRALESLVRNLAQDRPILVAGSTMQGEDEPVIEAFVAAGGGARALLVLVPRHPERWDAVASLVSDRGLRLVRRSRAGETPTDIAERPDVLLLDSMGELAGIYRLATAAFVGGTLVATGGHNPLEPARLGVPVLVGPSMFNFRQMATAFDTACAWRRVADAQELGAAWRTMLDQPTDAAALGRLGRDLIEAHRGALERTRTMLAPLLETVSRATVRGRR
jgi:3-deoxy-D-manno-octulosonic-acid transferase